MNKVILMGRLTKDADISVAQNQNQTVYARFSLAVDRRFKKDGGPTADFIRCLAFGKTAELIRDYTSKGTKICVEGEWQTDSYKNMRGDTVYTNTCVVSAFYFCESKGTQQQRKPASDNKRPELTEKDMDEFVNVYRDEDELPFL